MDDHLMPPERPRIDVLLSFVVLNLVANIAAAALTLMRSLTPVRTGVIAAAVRQSVASQF